MFQAAITTRTAFMALSLITGDSSENEDALAVIQLFVDPRLVGDEGAHAAVAGGVGRFFVVAVDGVAVVPVEGVVHALRVVARFLAVEAVVAGHRRGRGLAGRDRVDREGLVALGEDENLLVERNLGVPAGVRVADLVAAAAAEDVLDQALASALGARHAVDLAVGEHLTAGAPVEALAAAGVVAQLRHRLLEAVDDLVALAGVQGGEADPPALAAGGGAP